MKKITKLTQKQIDAMPKYIEKWIKIGTCTRPTDRVKATQYIKDAYKVAGLKPPKHIIFCGSPYSAILVAKITNKIPKDEKLMKQIFQELKNNYEKVDQIGNTVRNTVENTVRDTVKSTVIDTVGDTVWNAVGNTVIDTVGNTVKSTVENTVRNSVGNTVRNTVGDTVWNAVGNTVIDTVGNTVWNTVRNSYYLEAGFGQHDSSWLAYYNYFQEECKLSEEIAQLTPLMNLAQEVNWWYPYENYVFVSEKPEICKLKGTRLHNETGPAIRYNDGFEIYCLNNVVMPKSVFDVPKEELKAKDILAITNAEQRMQAMKLKGLGHFFNELKHKVIDKKDSYELLLVELNGEQCEHLKMVNPSTGEIHLEGVLPGIKTVNDALAWRNGLEYWVNPRVLT